MIASQVPVEVPQGQLFEQLTEGYRPALQHYITSYELGLPQFTMREVALMMHDAQIRLSMSLKTAPMLKPKITISGDPTVVQYVVKLIKKVWASEMHKILNALWWTASAGELVWKECQGQIMLDHMREIHPADVQILVKKGRKVGLRIQSNVFLHGFATSAWNGLGTGNIGSTAMAPQNPIPPLLGEKSFLYVHRRQFGSWIGRSEFEGAYRPWLTKNQRRGALNSRDLYFYKCVYHSGIIKHPPGAFRDVDGQVKLYRDLARQIMEWAENGAVYTLEQGLLEDGKTPKWEIEPAKVLGDGKPMLDYVDKLDLEITRGIEIPDDIVSQQSGTGSFSGRTIPLLSYYVSQEQHLRDIVVAVKNQILDAGVRLNFGIEAVHEYEIEKVEIDIDALMPKRPVVGPRGGAIQEASEDQDEVVDEEGPLVIGGDNQSTQFSQSGNFCVAVFTTDTVSAEASCLLMPGVDGGFIHQDTVQFADDVVRPLAPKCGMIIHGTFFRGGERIPKEVLDALSSSEKAKIASCQRNDGPQEPIKISAQEVQHREKVSTAKGESESTKQHEFPEELQTRVARQPRGQGSQIQISTDELQGILTHGKSTFISAGEGPEDENMEESHGSLAKDLNDGGFMWVPISGNYDGMTESSFMVMEMSQVDAVNLAKKHSQESVLMSDSGENWLVITEGENQGRSYPGSGWDINKDAKESFFSQVSIPGGEKVNFSLRLGSKPMVDQPPKDPDTESSHATQQLAHEDDVGTPSMIVNLNVTGDAAPPAPNVDHEKLWAKMDEIRPRLITVADSFLAGTVIPQEAVADVVIVGSATCPDRFGPSSDIDLHLVIDPEKIKGFSVENLATHSRLVSAAWNSKHHITIGNHVLEIFIEQLGRPAVSSGRFSVKNGVWIDRPEECEDRSSADNADSERKVKSLTEAINEAIESNDSTVMQGMLTRVRDLRQAGLSSAGETSPENEAFRAVRRTGLIDKLKDAARSTFDTASSIQFADSPE